MISTVPEVRGSGGGGVVRRLMISRLNHVQNISKIPTLAPRKTNKINYFAARKKADTFPDVLLLDPIHLDQKDDVRDVMNQMTHTSKDNGLLKENIDMLTWLLAKAAICSVPLFDLAPQPVFHA